MNGPLVGAGLALLAAAAVATATIAIRLGTARGRSADALVVVLAINSAILVPLALVLEYPDYGLTPESALAFLGAGVVGTLFGRGFHYASIERIGASRTEPIKASQPLHASLLAVVFLGEAVTGLHALGIVLITAGVALVVLTTSGESASAPTDAGLGALALPFTAAFLFGIEPIFAKVGFAAGTPVLVGLSIKTVAAGVGFVAYLAWTEGLNLATVRDGDPRWYVVAGVANTLFLLSYYTGLELSTVTVVVPILQTSPVFVVALSAAFLQDLERVSWRLAAGTLVVVVGSVVVTLVG